jgi:phage tail sheath protein FI
MANDLPIRPESGEEILRTHPDNPGPEWNYVNVRRYLVELEHSLNEGSQWVVFEPNGPALWARVRTTVSDFLTKEWQSGKLLGTTADQAFYVRCDQSTMTQNDIDNGRLNVVIGIAPVKPAEFVIINIGQWTADRKPKP